jgi:hypothetical protein
MASIGEKSTYRMNPEWRLCVRAAWCDILFKLSPEVNVGTVGSRQWAVGSERQKLIAVHRSFFTANCFKKGTKS